jgi:metal-responsive CopG/Arc/MetJ family transcriptional regulator
MLNRYQMRNYMNEKPIFKQLNFKLSEKQLEDLEKLSNAMGNVSKSNLIRIAITEYIMKYKDILKED